MFLLHFFADNFLQAAGLAVRISRTDDEIIGQGGQGGQVQHNNIVGLMFFQLFDNDMCQFGRFQRLPPGWVFNLQHTHILAQSVKQSRTGARFGLSCTSLG